MDGGVAKKGAVTSSQVADHAGVSQSAVSRTFTPGASISPKTRAKVLAAAKELGYRPSRVARQLATGRSNIIGVCFEQTSVDAFSSKFCGFFYFG